MTILQILVLALVQGITEFLPISSSGHLVLVPVVTGWPDQGLAIDVAVHVGTLVAVTLYFRHDVGRLFLGLADLARGRTSGGGRLALMLALATLPAILGGLVLHRYAGDLFRPTPDNLAFVTLVIGWTTIGFGLLLWAADRLAPARRDGEDLSYGEALMIGIAQALALIPGTSRSGVTMTAARMLSLTRVEAARFSLLLSIPVILAAGALSTVDIVEAGDVELGGDAVLAAALAFVSAWLAIAVMMRWLRRASFTPFVIYRLALGTALLVYAYN